MSRIMGPTEGMYMWANVLAAARLNCSADDPTEATELMSEAEANALANPEFHYNEHYKVLICMYHGLAVIGLDRHLKDAHNLRKKKERQRFLDQYSELVCAKPQDVALPPPNGPSFDALKRPPRG